MDDFRYNEHAHALEEKLEEVMDTHVKEKEEAAAAEAKEAASKVAAESSGLERLAQGETPLDQVKKIIEAKKEQSKTASSLVREHRVREFMRKTAGRGRELVTTFLATSKEN